MESISNKRKTFSETTPTKDNKRNKVTPEETSNKKKDEIQQIALKSVESGELQSATIQVLGRELDIKYGKSKKNEKILKKIQNRAKFITENSKELPLTESKERKRIFVSDISLSSVAQFNPVHFKPTCLMCVHFRIGALNLTLPCDLSAKDFKNKYTVSMASVKKICDLYIKLNEIYGDKGFIPLTDSFDDNLELKIDELTTNVFKNIGCCRHIEIQGHDFFFTANLENIYFVQDEKGSGAEGTVFQVLDILDTSENKIKALREVECVKNTKALSEIEKGWNILRFLHELNNEQPIKGIQKLIGNVTPVQETLEFKRFFTISDLAYGSLFRYAIQEKSFGSEAMPRRVTLLRELLEGLEFAHNNAIVHGDIKPDNVLVYLTPGGLVSHLIICDWDGAACKDEVPLMATAIYRPSINDKNYKKYDVFAIAKTIAEALNQNKLNLEQQNLINPKFFNENSKNQRMKLLAEFRTNAVPAEITTSLVKGLSTPTPSIAELKDSFQMKAEN